MKKLRKTGIFRFFATFLFSVLSIAVWAQNNQNTNTGSSSSQTTTTETTTTSDWYTQPWVWIAGGAVFIIILVALLRGNSSDREVSRTTVVKSDRTV